MTEQEKRIYEFLRDIDLLHKQNEVMKSGLFSIMSKDMVVLNKDSDEPEVLYGQLGYIAYKALDKIKEIEYGSK